MTKLDQNLEACFTKEHRLLKSSDFNYVFNSAPIKASHPNLLILAKPNCKAHARLGLVIAKKHVKTAVGRNAIKRVARESFRNRLKNLPPIDVIVLARKGADQLENSDLHKVFNGLWKRVNKKYASSCKLDSTCST